jgi:VIT1/CCC1 family predicted Fe2+/Mn2+ transporter
VVASIVIGVVAALLLGGFIGAMAGRSVPGTAMRQLAVAVLAAGVTFGVGHLLGVSAQ